VAIGSAFGTKTRRLASKDFIIPAAASIRTVLLRRRKCKRQVGAPTRVHPQSAAMKASPSALRTTTSQGGTCHMNRRRNATVARAKSAALRMPAVQTG
jgi:hypothetical protein